MLRAIDISDDQSATPDLTGVDLVLIKATEGHTYVNPRMAAQAAHARAEGKQVAFYHFLWPDNIAAQVKWFVEQCASVEGDSLWIDWETTEAGTHASCAEKDQALAGTKSLRPTHRVGLYNNLDFWKSVDTTSDCGDGLWVADPGAAAGHPRVEHPWLIHQFAIARGTDQDVVNFGSVAELAAWSGGAVPTPPKPPVAHYVPYPGAKWFTVGRKSQIITAMHKRLVAVGCNRYKTTTNTDVIGSGDVASYELWQAEYNKVHHKGWTGAALKWPPGKETWDALEVPES